MPTALDLFWDLSQPAKEQRLDASAKLVNALQLFQQSHLVQLELSTAEKQDLLSLDALNAHDVAYALRRLVRGLASPRESSRLGFAVVLTELLSRLETVTSSQMIDLVLASSEATGSLNGQEERDMMFSRLFGLASVSQSGLIIREARLLHTSSPASTIQDYQRLITELLTLGEFKSWFRESCWWSIVQVISQMSTSTASFKSQALEWTFNQLFIQMTEWTPEKVGVWLRFHSLWDPNASIPLKHVFKGQHVLSPGSLPQLAQILKDTEPDEGERPKQASPGLWKASPHFVWSIIFDVYFKTNEAAQRNVSPFHDFFRVVVDESIFSATSSPERKYTGFQLVESALNGAPDSSKPHLFTKNFIRTWINQLSKKDRYLHKAALKLASTVHRIVKENPSTGFPLVVQLLGPNGSRDFDRITNTKTVEIILANMSVAQIMEYVQYLVVVFRNGSPNNDKTSIDSDQRWTLEQFSSLIRSSTVPKSDSWVTFILNFYVQNGFFIRKAKKTKEHQSDLSEPIRSLCRTKLSSALAELSSQSVAEHHDAKTSKFHGRASTGDFWITQVTRIMKMTGEDKNVHGVFDAEEDVVTLRTKAWSVIKSLNEVQGQGHEEAQGALLLVSSILLQTYDAVTDDAEGTPVPALEDCLENVTRMFNLVAKSQKKRKANGVAKIDVDQEDFKPIDLIVDGLIGYLEKSTTLMRTISGQVFTALCSKVEQSTMDLLLEQIQRRSVLPEVTSETEDESMEGEEDLSAPSNGDSGTEYSDGSDSSDSDSEDVSEDANDDQVEQGDVDPEFRRKVAEALGAIGFKEDDAESGSDDSSEVLMDDDQMMQLDDKLADIFRAQSTVNKGKIEAGLQREATHFKIRVLDLLDTFARKCPDSPQLPRIVMPLIHVIMEAGTDEQQLIDKTNGILRKRIGVSQTLPEKGVDVDSLSKDLEEVHNIARKASHQKISPATLSACNILLSRILVHHQGLEVVAKTHRETLDNFMSKKGSKVNHAFLADFITRVPLAAWEIRRDLIQACASERSVNTYRQMQAVQWMNSLLTQTLQATNNQEEILNTMLLIRETTHNSMHNASIGEHPLTVAQAKNIVKMALQAIRITARVDPTSLERVWNIKQCNSMLTEVQTSQTLSKDAGLIALVRQIIARLGPAGEKDEGSKDEKAALPKAKKRKADGTEVEKSRKKVKRNKKYATS